MKILVAALLVLIFAIPATAQQIDIRSAPPAKERPDFVAPGPQLEVTHPRENEWYPEGVRVPFDPAFVAPLSEEYETATTRGRYGIAGWTAQNMPVGAPGTQYREQHGWLMFGFAFTWGAAPRPPMRPASGAPRSPAPARRPLPLLRGNLHAHTTFSDGVRTPQALVDEYETRGYDFLAITDHEDHDNLVEPHYERALEKLAAGLLLFRGRELSYRRFAQHVGRVDGDEDTLWVLNHPARYKLSVGETLDRIAEIRRAGWPLDAIEVSDTGKYRPLYDTPAIPLVKVATDDAHYPMHFGRAWIEVDAARSRDAIIRAIRAGDARIVFAKTSS